MSFKDARTASADISIWRDLPEETFRQRLLILEERTNTIPMDPRVFNSADWKTSTGLHEAHGLPIEVEQQVADDFACLVAVSEGAQSVAAVCIEENIEQRGTTLRFAAMDISIDDSVKMALRAISNILIKAASSESVDTDSGVYVEELFETVVKLHELRLLARLRSDKWEKPKYLSKSHKKPLWQDFINLIHRAQFAYTKSEKAKRQLVESQLKNLSQIYESFEKATENISSLKSLIKSSFTFCSQPEIKEYLHRLLTQTTPTAQISAAVKSVRQIQKIAAYRRISMSLIQSAREYPSLFQTITLAYLTPYAPVPTSIGYHTWATTLHIHAEVQLAVYYDLHPNLRLNTNPKSDSNSQNPKPRCIGTSKWLCWLCYRFLEQHGQFFPSKTHGQIFDQWTIPDLEEFEGDIREKYRAIVGGLDGVIRLGIEDEEVVVDGGRLKPMTSCTVD